MIRAAAKAFQNGYRHVGQHMNHPCMFPCPFENRPDTYCVTCDPRNWALPHGHTGIRLHPK